MEEIENSDFLTIEIKYKKSISLYDFKESLEGWYNQYNKYLSQTNKVNEGENLLIKDIKDGSIIITLITSAMPVLAHIETFNTITDFFSTIKNSISWLSTQKGTKPKYDIDELQNIKQIVSPITNIDNSMNLTVNGNIEIENVFVIDNIKAKVTRENADKEIKLLSKIEPVEPLKDDTFRENVYLRFKQIESAEKNTRSTKGIIDEIDNKSYPISFAEGLKQQIIHGIDNPLIKIYLVNVKIHKEDNTICGYTVLKIIDSFNDDENYDLQNDLGFT